MNRDINRLEHILEAIDRIAELTSIDYSEYEVNRDKQEALIANFIKLGEAASKLSQELREKHSEISWRHPIGMRNILVHDYVKIDYHQLWLTARNDLTVLKAQIQDILDDISKE